VTAAPPPTTPPTPATPAPTPVPVMSVVIPTAGLHRRTMLHTCLRALAACPGITATEVLVVLDGGDPAQYQSIVDDMRGALPRLRLLTRTQGGPAAARNTGWRGTDADVVAFIDDDTAPAPGWLADIEQAFAHQPHLVAAGGRVLPLEPHNVVSRMMTDMGHLDHRDGPQGPLLIGANIAVRRHALDAIGGFDERYTDASGEDVDLCVRLLDAGAHLARLDGAVVRHRHPVTYDEMIANCQRYRASAHHITLDAAAHVVRRPVWLWARGVRDRVLALADRSPLPARVVAALDVTMTGALFTQNLPRWYAQARRASPHTTHRSTAMVVLLHWRWFAEWHRHRPAANDVRVVDASVV
jgi:GT2 family glycosyltransferase